MGTTARVIVSARAASIAEELAGLAARRILELERRWTRFSSTSEIARLHAAPRGVPVLVSTDTVRLVETATTAWRLTDGAYDPTVHDALVALGYDRTFEDLVAAEGPGVAYDGGVPAPGAAGIVVDPVLRSVTLPPGTSFDPGGIGKGLAADLIVEELLARDAIGALVDLGGDIRCGGEGPADGAWIIEVDPPSLPRLALRDAGIATSSTRRRRWQSPDGVRHHLVDPATGAPARGPFTDATAIAPTAWLAEAATKAALVRGRTDVHPAVHVVLHGATTTCSPILQELSR